jgi:hypothetical protein
MPDNQIRWEKNKGGEDNGWMLSICCVRITVYDDSVYVRSDNNFKSNNNYRIDNSNGTTNMYFNLWDCNK